MLTGQAQAAYDANRGPRPATVVTIPLRLMRELSGLSTRQLVKRISEVGGDDWSPATISKVETGDRGSSPKLREDLAAAFGLPSGAVHEEDT